jgi:hypothetical protein
VTTLYRFAYLLVKGSAARRHHDEPAGRQIDDGMRFLSRWEDEDGWQPWRGAGDQKTREAVKALLRVRAGHANEIRDRGSCHVD